MGLTKREMGAYARAHPLRPPLIAPASAPVRRPARWAGLVFVFRWLADRLYFRWLQWRTRRRVPHG